MTAVTITNWAGVAFHVWAAAVVAVVVTTVWWLDRRDARGQR